MAGKALILVDLQNDYMPGGSLAVDEGDQLVPIANRLMVAFDVVVATQDWHPPGHGSFADSHEGREVGETIDLDSLPQILLPVHCVRETPGAAFHKDLDVNGIDKVFHKGMDLRIDGYSGFFDNGHRQSTGLGEFLQQEGVDEVFICGLATDNCVKFTALDAAGLGYRTHLIADVCRGVNLEPGDVDHAIEEMRKAGVDIIQSDDILGG